jgi:hypothetical protein
MYVNRADVVDDLFDMVEEAIQRRDVCTDMVQIPPLVDHFVDVPSEGVHLVNVVVEVAVLRDSLEVATDFRGSPGRLVLHLSGQ